MNMKALWGMPMPLNSARISAVVIAAITSQALASESTEMNPLVKANTAFALQLYGKLRSTEGNLALSPYSISSALAMMYAGARGDTARQMEQTLHFDQSKTGLHELFGRLDAALKAAQGSNELSIANSLWPQAKYPFREEFLNLLNRDYGATVTPLNYEREAELARVTINQWVDDKTRHKIAELIGPGVLDALTRMVLVNAIYFKGTWATPFPESATQPDKFYAQPEHDDYRAVHAPARPLPLRRERSVANARPAVHRATTANGHPAAAPSRRNRAIGKQPDSGQLDRVDIGDAESTGRRGAAEIHNVQRFQSGSDT